MPGLRSHVIAVNVFGGFDYAPDLWLVALNLDQPFVVDIVAPTPAVLEAGAGC